MHLHVKTRTIDATMHKCKVAKMPARQHETEEEARGRRAGAQKEIVTATRECFYVCVG